MPFIGNIGPGELILILIIALVVFGPGKLPEVGQALGKGIREFRRAASDVTEATRVDPVASSTTQPALPPPVAQAPAPAPSPTPADAPATTASTPSTPADPDHPAA